MSIFAATQTIPEYFQGKSIFITGATGFMGKVLVEKLLRSCPDLEKLYVLMREKKGKTPRERLAKIVDLPLFDRVKAEQPNFIDKIHVITGDVTKLNLGLSPEERELLIENVHIVYHAAASVRFDDPLTDAIILNTRGTREVAGLALEMKKIAVFVHISTSYCQSDKKIVEERAYPPHADWKMAIRIAEEMDRHSVDILTAKYMGELPNTYTFTKSLAEHVVTDMCDGKIPAVIVRPSIVISTVKEPVHGWIDNFNGPVGLLIASGKGIVSSVIAGPNVIADYIPVDIAIKGLIISTWHKAMFTNINDRLSVTFYNCSNYNIRSITMSEMINMAKSLTFEAPLEDQLWSPSGNITDNRFFHYLNVIFFHLLPSFVLDLLLKALGKKPILVMLQRRIYIANMALQYFLTNEWLFVNDKFFKLQDILLQSDKEAFDYDISYVDVYNYFKNAMIGAKMYLLKEDLNKIDKAKAHANRMWVLRHVVQVLKYVFLAWFLIFKINIIGYLYSTLHAYLVL